MKKFRKIKLVKEMITTLFVSYIIVIFKSTIRFCKAFANNSSTNSKLSKT